MARRAIPITEKNGQYEIAPNVRPESYKAIMASASTVRVVEALRNLDYDWVIETDLGRFFVTGRKRPKEKEIAPDIEICIPAGETSVRYARQQDARLAAKEWGGHIHRVPTADRRSHTYCVCDNPACTG